jgi:hypothetical protein
MAGLTCRNVPLDSQIRHLHSAWLHADSVRQFHHLNHELSANLRPVRDVIETFPHFLLAPCGILRSVGSGSLHFMKTNHCLAFALFHVADIGRLPALALATTTV